MPRNEVGETRELRKLTAVLRKEFSGQVTSPDIDLLVLEAFRAFDDAPLRDYVFVLTERAVRRDLAQQCASSVTTDDRRLVLELATGA